MTLFGSWRSTRAKAGQRMFRASSLEVQRRADLEGRELIGTLATFVENHTRNARQLRLRLA
jgi:hypothetical protein